MFDEFEEETLAFDAKVIFMAIKLKPRDLPLENKKFSNFFFTFFLWKRYKMSIVFGNNSVVLEDASMVSDQQQVSEHSDQQNIESADQSTLHEHSPEHENDVIQKKVESDILEKQEASALESVEPAKETLATPDPLLVKEQFKWTSAMIRNMKKRKDAFIFLNPVDPVALNIPTYFTVIKNPMDISTIEKKIQSNSYLSVVEVFKDFDLMFDNCYTFNGHESAVALMSKTLQRWYEGELKKMPRSMEQIEMKKKKKADMVSVLNSQEF